MPSPAEMIRALLSQGQPSLSAIAEAFEALGPDDRVAATRGLNRADQRRLFELAGTGAPATLEDLAPASAGPRRAVIHHGTNTLPLPASQRAFQKRFARPDDGSARLFGYNEAPTRWLIGPGYFVTHSTEGESAWAPRGAIVVNYFLIPDGPVPDGWPPVIPNTQGLQWFVYNKTRDFMRRVSDHLTIGAAYKEEKALDHYFTLVRED